MGDYINLDIETIPEEMSASVIEFIQTVYPDWEPADGNLEARILDGVSRLAAEGNDLVSVVADQAFQKFGVETIQVDYQAAAPAVGDTTWTMIDDAGYTVLAGTTVSIEKTGDTKIGFETIADFTVAPGHTATAAGAVPIRAIIDGADGNELTNDPDLIDALDYVDHVDLVGTTTDGADAETPEEYMSRLTEELRLMSGTPILEEDFAILIRRNPSVVRSIAIANWNPTLDTLGNERYVGGVGLDEDGQDISALTKTAIEDDINARRETNFVFEMGEPTYNTIDIDLEGRAYETFDTATVEANVLAALEDYLHPLKFGNVPFGGDSLAWRNADKVRFNEIVQVVNSAEGFNFIEPAGLEVNGGTADITLLGTVPLTEVGTINITINAGP
jgi:hypothetical protein